MTDNRTETRLIAGIDRKAQHSAARHAVEARLAREARHATEALGEALAVAERFLSPTDRRMRREARVEAELRQLAAEEGPAMIPGFLGILAHKLGRDLNVKAKPLSEAEKVIGGGE